jgi:hypothetical protein
MLWKKFFLSVLFFYAVSISFAQNQELNFNEVFRKEVKQYKDSLLNDKFWSSVRFVVFAVVKSDTSEGIQCVITHEYNYLTLPFLAPNGKVLLDKDDYCLVRIVGDPFFLERQLDYEPMNCLAWRNMPEVIDLLSNFELTINTFSRSIYLRFSNGRMKSRQILSTHEEIPNIDEELWIYETDE